MNTDHFDAVLADLDPEEVPGALHLLAVMEKAGWVTPREATEWRGRLAAWGVFHEDPQLWIDGPEG